MNLLKKFKMNNDRKEKIDKIANTEHYVQQKTINNENTLIIKDLSNYSRIEYQNLCGKIGLHHRSFSSTKFVGHK
jgi:C4-type Zn-finger protein